MGAVVGTNTTIVLAVTSVVNVTTVVLTVFVTVHPPRILVASVAGSGGGPADQVVSAPLGPVRPSGSWDGAFGSTAAIAASMLGKTSSGSSSTLESTSCT